MKKHSAFTLLEILVALAILAIAFLAILRTTESNIANSIHVKKSLAAHWIAMNVLSKLELGLIEKPADGNDVSANVSMLNSQWHWVAHIDKGSGKSTFMRIAIDVYQHKKRYQHLIGFIDT